MPLHLKKATRTKKKNTDNNETTDNEEPNKEHTVIMVFKEEDKNIIKCPEELEDALNPICICFSKLISVKPNYAREVIAFIFKSEKEARKLLKITNIYTNQKQLLINCRWAKSENFNYGIIKGIMPPTGEEDRERRTQNMKQKLYNQGAPVKEIMWIKKKNSESEIKETNAVRLEFINEAPKEVFLGYVRYIVYDYVPEVTQCFNCQGFGHVAKYCQNTTKCVQCGFRGHRKSENKCRPPDKIRCNNCYGGHKDWSKRCPYYLKEVEALKIRGRTKTTMHMASNLAEEAFPTLNPATGNHETESDRKMKKGSYAEAAHSQNKPKSDYNQKKKYRKRRSISPKQPKIPKKHSPEKDTIKIVQDTITSLLPNILLPIIRILIEVVSIPGETTGKLNRVTEVCSRNPKTNEPRNQH